MDVLRVCCIDCPYVESILIPFKGLPPDIYIGLESEESSIVSNGPLSVCNCLLVSSDPHTLSLYASIQRESANSAS